MDIMFINQQALFATIEKYVRFRVLFPLANRTKEYFYRDMDVLMRHKKAVFDDKSIEYCGGFKSVMDEV